MASKISSTVPPMMNSPALSESAVLDARTKEMTAMPVGYPGDVILRGAAAETRQQGFGEPTSGFEPLTPSLRAFAGPAT